MKSIKKYTPYEVARVSREKISAEVCTALRSSILLYIKIGTHQLKGAAPQLVRHTIFACASKEDPFLTHER